MLGVACSVNRQLEVYAFCRTAPTELCSACLISRLCTNVYDIELNKYNCENTELKMCS